MESPARRVRRPERSGRATIKKQLLELQALHEVAKRAAALDVQGTLESVVTVFERLTTADSTAIYLWSLENPGFLELSAYRFDHSLYPEDYAEKLKGRISPKGYGLIGWVAEHREPLMIGDVSKDLRTRAIPGIPLDNKSAIVVPVVANEAVLGVIRAIKMGVDAFTAEHFRLAQTLAHQSAVALAAAEAQREQAYRLAENQRLARVVQARETRLRALIAASPLAIIEIDLDGNVRLWNEAAERIFGWTAAEVVGGRALFVPPEREEEFNALLAGIRAGGSIDDFETVCQRREGSRIDVALSAAPLRGQGDEVVGTTALIADITSRKRVERQLAHQALHDVLTDLPNRTLFQDRLARAIARARRDGAKVALLLMDLDDFKDVNDTFGHVAGDALLRELGPRLQARLRETDTLARLGGDEFAMVLPDADERAALRIADALRSALQRPFTVEGQSLALDASIGVAVYPSHGDSGDALLRRADIAMYAAKRSKAGATLYGPEHAGVSAGRLTAVAALRRAIEGEELRLHFQPIVALREKGLLGAEALVRWAHPERGLVPPAEFIPFAERTGLIAPLTAWVVRSALLSTKCWRDEHEKLYVSVNLSAHDLLDPNFPSLVQHALAESGVEPARLCLEVTEGTLMADADRCTATLRALRAIGARVAIDDFGVGYSSLAYLDRLPIDMVKIDRSFIARLATGRGSAAIVRSVIDLAHHFGLETIGEGIEDEAAYRHLEALGCDAVQGFLIARPLAPEAFCAWLSQAGGTTSA